MLGSPLGSPSVDTNSSSPFKDAPPTDRPYKDLTDRQTRYQKAVCVVNAPGKFAVTGTLLMCRGQCCVLFGDQANALVPRDAGQATAVFYSDGGSESTAEAKLMPHLLSRGAVAAGAAVGLRLGRVGEPAGDAAAPPVDAAPAAASRAAPGAPRSPSGHFLALRAAAPAPARQLVANRPVPSPPPDRRRTSRSARAPAGRSPVGLNSAPPSQRWVPARCTGNLNPFPGCVSLGASAQSCRKGRRRAHAAPKASTG
jgi:hypothetical protein